MLGNLLSLFTNFIHVILGINTPQNFPPPLTYEDERIFFEKMSHGDTVAREKLILHNLRLVSHIVRKYYASAKNSEDLVSIGTVGLVKAVDSFQHAKGTRFATYAAKCIQNEILMHFRSQKKLASEVSLNDTIDVDRDGNPLTYMDVISSEEQMEDEIERKIYTARALHYVKTILSQRERQIIIMRYGLGGRRAMTQREVAEALKISRSYVSRIEKSALEKLQDAFVVPKVKINS
jgi:RNA polymerase sporulation-specific sigma factor